MSISSLAARPAFARWATRQHEGQIVALLLTIFAIHLPGAASAQTQMVGGRNEVFAGSDLESYLRYLQTVGKSQD
jgi:hypothetical protein